MRRALLTLVLALPLLAACQLSLPGRDRAAEAAPTPVMGEAITTTTLDAPAATPAAPTTPEAAATPAAAAALPATATMTSAPPSRPAKAAPDQTAAQTATTAPAPLPEPLATPAPKSDAQIACEKSKGLWTRTGQGNIMACIRKTRDSGKTCDSKSDCQGECLARSRTCAPFRPMFGCNAVLNTNGAEVTLCLD